MIILVIIMVVLLRFNMSDYSSFACNLYLIFVSYQGNFGVKTERRKIYENVPQILSDVPVILYFYHY